MTITLLRRLGPLLLGSCVALGLAPSATVAEELRIVAEELAARFRLRVVGSWPMPALGVDCFVMEAPENLPLESLIESMALGTIDIYNGANSSSATGPRSQTSRSRGC